MQVGYAMVYFWEYFGALVVYAFMYYGRSIFYPSFRCAHGLSVTVTGCLVHFTSVWT